MQPPRGSVRETKHFRTPTLHADSIAPTDWNYATKPQTYVHQRRVYRVCQHCCECRNVFVEMNEWKECIFNSWNATSASAAYMYLDSVKQRVFSLRISRNMPSMAHHNAYAQRDLVLHNRIVMSSRVHGKNNDIQFLHNSPPMAVCTCHNMPNAILFSSTPLQMLQKWNSRNCVYRKGNCVSTIVMLIGAAGVEIR